MSSVLFTVPENPKVGPNWRAPLARASGALKGGTISDFLTSILLQNIEKIEGRSLWRKKIEKVSQSQKNERGPLVSPGIVCYAEQKEQFLYFSSLCQMLVFDTSLKVS